MLRLVTLIVAATFAIKATAEDVVQSLPGGEINWTKGFVYATAPRRLTSRSLRSAGC